MKDDWEETQNDHRELKTKQQKKSNDCVSQSGGPFIEGVVGLLPNCA